MKKLKSLSIIMAVMMTSQSGVRNFAVSAMDSDVQGQSVGGTLSNELNQLKELQEILYLDPINQENLTKQIETLRTVCSAEEIDRELIMAMSLNYQRIPVLIPFLSKKEVNKKMLPHCDQDFLTILLKNGIDITDLKNILGLNGEWERTLEEELVVEMEKKGIEFDKSKVLIRKKSKIEKVIEEDDIEGLRLLSNQRGFDPNQKIYKENLQLGYYTETPIISFCIEKHAIKCFKFLLLNGSNPLSKTDGYCMDGMSFAASIGNLQIMGMIEEKGGIIGTEVGECAAKFHQNHVLKWILQKQLQIDWKEVFCKAVRFDNLEGISLMLKYGVEDINDGRYYVETPLHIAARNNLTKIVEWLISEGADINARNENEETPLHVASVESGKLLINKGADINAEDDSMYTPLHLVASGDFVEIGDLLISQGANVNAISDRGETPLHRAAYFDSNKMGELLISKGADINAESDLKETPLHCAAEFGSVKVAELLISKGADINVKNWRGKTPLHIAVEKGNVKMVGLLISNGADVNAVDNKGVYAEDDSMYTPLHLVASGDFVEIGDLLISQGADINAESDLKETPLHCAAEFGSVKVAELLISKGADINVKNWRGKTPLHIAVEKGNVKMVGLLISNGADVNAVDNKGKMPLVYAVQDSQIWQLLLLKK